MDMLHWSVSMLSFLAQPPLPWVVGDGWREQWLERLETVRPLGETWLAHQRRDAYWQHGSVRERLRRRSAAPVMAIGGWTDGYTDAVLRLLDGLDVPRRGVIGPWGHNDTEAGVPGPGAGVLREVVRWCDRWLKGIDNGADDEPMLVAYLQDRIVPAGRCAVRPGRWVTEQTWPSPDVEVRDDPVRRRGRDPRAAGVRPRLRRLVRRRRLRRPAARPARRGRHVVLRRGRAARRGRRAARLRARVVHRHLGRAARAGRGAALRRRAGRRLAAGHARHAEPRAARVTRRARAAGAGPGGARHDHARRHRPPVRRRPPAAARLLADLLAAGLAVAAGGDAADLRRRARATARGRRTDEVGRAVRAAAVPAEARGRVDDGGHRRRGASSATSRPAGRR